MVEEIINNTDVKTDEKQKQVAEEVETPSGPKVFTVESILLSTNCFDRRLHAYAVYWHINVDYNFHIIGTYSAPFSRDPHIV